MKPKHLPLPPESCNSCIVVGDPIRACDFSQSLDEITFDEQNREYRLIQGRYKRKVVTLCSHGVGSAGALLCFNELVQIGAQEIVRIGTCGALQDSLQAGDVVIASKALALDGPTQTLHGAKALVESSENLTTSLKDSFKVDEISCEFGPVVTSDLFYEEVPNYPLTHMSEESLLAIDMETSTLFGFAKRKNIEAASILVVDGNPLKWDEGNYHAGSQRVKAALETVLKRVLENLGEHE